MKAMCFEQITALAVDPANGWSIGSFGAIGEFVRDPDEPMKLSVGPDRIEISTACGAMRIAPQGKLRTIAWDSLSRDGESWGHAVAFCCPRLGTVSRAIRALGCDEGAIRVEDRGGHLFDLGVAAGAVTMALRTSDAALIAALEAQEGQALLSVPALMGEVLRAQPHRVLISPAGRVEVFQPIPPADGKSPIGPHTHLLPKLIAKDRSNTPIPEGWQAALNLHPRSPWRTMLGERHEFRPDIDAAFAPLLEKYGLPEDRAVERALRAAVAEDCPPERAVWPETRRGCTKARIVLRRMAAEGDSRAAAWRALHDRLPIEIEEGEDA